MNRRRALAIVEQQDGYVLATVYEQDVDGLRVVALRAGPETWISRRLVSDLALRPSPNLLSLTRRQ